VLRKKEVAAMKTRTKTTTRRSPKTNGTRAIEQQLTALERHLRAELQQRLANVQNAARGDPTELLDMVAEGEIDYMSAVSAEAGSATINEVHRALQKLHEGTYGVCEACGKPIKKRRLKARPFAILCIGCKEREERRRYSKMPGAAVARPNSGVTVDLTNEDAQEAEAPIDEIFRDVEDVEINEIY
jgi:DnaK suppressor protein